MTAVLTAKAACLAHSAARLHPIKEQGGPRPPVSRKSDLTADYSSSRMFVAGIAEDIAASPHRLDVVLAARRHLKLLP